MKVYDVINRDEGYNERFFSLPEAKKAMREHSASGYITKIYSNGDWVPCGEIKLRGSNKVFIANTMQEKPNY